jgi:cobalt-zinc-cadmium efflux system outer membrane protein
MRQSIQRAAGLAALLVLTAGCAGSHLREWRDPLYLRHVATGDRQAESHDRITPRPADPGSQGEPPAISPDAALRIDDAIRYAVMNHPALRRQAYGVRAAAWREIQSRLSPNPSFAVEAEALGSDAGRGGETAFLLEQELVTSGKLAKTGAVAEADRLLAQSSFQEAVFGVATRVRGAFVAAVASEQRLISERELLSLADELLTSADAQVEAGAATEPDRLRAEVVREQAAIGLYAAESSAAAARRNLAATLGIDGALEATLVGDLMALPALPSREETLARALEQNTRIERALLAIERARRAHELARAQSIPNLRATLGPRYSDPERETTIDFGLGIEVPLFDRNQGEIAATTADRLAAGASLGAVRLELIGAVSQAWSSYESALFAVESYRSSLIPKAERTLDLTRQAYRAGKTDYLRLLDAQQTYVRSRIAYVDALEALHQAAAVLEGLMQSSLPWRDAGVANNMEGSK